MDFLVKLSRNSKVMIPIVVVLALSIFGGSYAIRNRQNVAREQAAQQATPEATTQTDNLRTQDQEQPVVDSPDTSVTSDNADKTVGSDLVGASVAIEVEVENEDTGTFIHVKPHDAKPGVCVLYIGGQQRDKVNTSDNECTFNYKPVEGDKSLAAQVTYQADDQSMSGIQAVSL